MHAHQKRASVDLLRLSEPEEVGQADNLVWGRRHSQRAGHGSFPGGGKCLLHSGGGEFNFVLGYC